MPKISIIVPVYNVESYVEESFNSLLSQSFDDFEIIAVNDGSTDASLEILNKLAKQDARVRVISQENAGPSAARNIGMQHAMAPITCFLDADDFFYPDALEFISKSFDNANDKIPALDILVFGADCFPKEACTPWHLAVLHPRDVEFIGFDPALVFNEATRPFHWRCAFRTDFLRVHKIEFDRDLRLGEDQAFLFAAYIRAQRVLLSSKVLYGYRVMRDNSAMDQTLQDKNSMMKKHLDIASVIFNDWQDSGYLQQYAAQMAAWLVEFMLYDTLFLDDAPRLLLLKNARTFLLSYWSKNELSQMGIPRAALAILLAVLEDPNIDSRKARRLQARYYLQQYGVISALKGVLRRIAHKG